MRRLVLVATMVAATVLATKTSAAVTAEVKVQCSGRSGSQVAIRWGHPNHDTAEYMPRFTTPCGVGVRQASLNILDAKSEFEIQTEGGIETAYTVQVSILRDNRVTDSIQLDHSGAVDVRTSGRGFSLNRSSGPNKYGEQNFRVQLSNPPPVTARIVARSQGDRSNAQMALRWGHPDFHDNEYFPLWTVRAGAAQQKSFQLRHDRSEFEIQTEGGEGTAYHLSIWLDFGGVQEMQPAIEISHHLAGTNVTTSTTNVSFDAGKGNEYGETNVRVTIPGLPTTRPTCTAGVLSMALVRQSTDPSGIVIFGGTTPSLPTVSCTNLATWVEVIGVGYPVKLLPPDDRKCASDRAVALGPTFTRTRTTASEMTSLYGSESPPLPIPVLACIFAGASLPDAISVGVGYSSK